jgi:hypothetical protein
MFTKGFAKTAGQTASAMKNVPNVGAPGLPVPPKPPPLPSPKNNKKSGMDVPGSLNGVY